MGGIGPDHNIVQLLRTLFCEVMFQRKAAAWKSNQIILSDVVLHILKDVMILQFFFIGPCITHPQPESITVS